MPKLSDLKAQSGRSYPPLHLLGNLQGEFVQCLYRDPFMVLPKKVKISVKRHFQNRMPVFWLWKKADSGASASIYCHCRIAIYGHTKLTQGYRIYKLNFSYEIASKLTAIHWGMSCIYHAFEFLILPLHLNIDEWLLKEFLHCEGDCKDF